MTAIDAATRYFDAWNAHDGDALQASLAPGATYVDPGTGVPIAGQAIRDYAASLWAAFPDLRFEVRSVGETGPGSVAAEWIMRGTNTGSFKGLPPSGRTVELPGADFISTVDGKVASVTGYFDSAETPRQLGLQIIVQPQKIGPFGFGTCTEVRSGRMDAPAAFSVTQLNALDDERVASMRDWSRKILTEMLAEPAFIGATTAAIGRRMVTVTAWADPDAPAAFARKASHAESMKAFFEGTMAESGYTGVFSPLRINPYHVRCASCGRMRDPDRTGATCGCGAALPAHPPYW